MAVVQRPHQRLFTWLVQALAYAVAAILVLGIVGTTQRFTIGGHHWLEYYGFALLLLMLILGAPRIAAALDHVPGRRFLVLVIGLFVVSRMLWIWFVPTQPLHDAAVYHSFAQLLSQHRPLPTDTLFFPAWGYPLFLGVVYSFAGSHVFVGQMLNVALGVISLWLFYTLALLIAGPRIARTATLLLVFWPNYLAFTGVLATEHLALVFLLAFMIALIRGMSSTIIIWTYLVGAGVYLAGMIAVRPALLVALSCFVPAFFLCRGCVAQKFGRLAVIAALFAVSYGVFYLGTTLVYHRAPVASSVPFLMGSNYAALGRWNQDDADQYRKVAQDMSYAEANAFATRTAIERIRSNPFGFAKLMARKLLYFWEDDTYGVYYSTERLLDVDTAASSQQSNSYQPASRNVLQAVLVTRALANQSIAEISGAFLIAAQYYYLYMLIFGAIGAIYLANHGYDGKIEMILIFLLTTSAFHMITEVLHRYRFSGQVLLLIVVAIGLCRPLTLSGPDLRTSALAYGATASEPSQVST